MVGSICTDGSGDMKWGMLVVNISDVGGESSGGECVVEVAVETVGFEFI